MLRRHRLVIVMSALLAVVAPAGASAVEGAQRTGLGIRLLEAPAALKDDPRAQSYIIDDVTPGTTFERRIAIVNDTGSAASIDLYSAPAVVESGSFTAGARGEASELTRWITVTPGTVDLPDGASAEAVVRVSVPVDASDGERYAAVFAELRGRGGDGVQIASRVGIRIYLSVAQGGAPAPDFVVDALEPARGSDGRPIVQAIVTNTGGRALDMSGSLTLSEGPGGLSAGPFTADLGTTLAPGQSQPVRVALDPALPNGPWTARIDLRSGLLERSATATITFPEPGEAGPRVTAAPVPLAQDPSVVVPIAIGLLALAFLLLLWALWRRRRGDDRDDEQQTVVPVVPAARRSADDTVRS